MHRHIFAYIICTYIIIYISIELFHIGYCNIYGYMFHALYILYILVYHAQDAFCLQFSQAC